jgi:hypothetical protein
LTQGDRISSGSSLIANGFVLSLETGRSEREAAITYVAGQTKGHRKADKMQFHTMQAS